jgi:predicted transcriptional regulator
MKIMWELENASVRQVLNKIERKNKPAYTTVMTVMTRLYNKGILKRVLNSHDAYIYTPAQDKKNFLASFSKKIISRLINECGEDIAVAQFIDVINNDSPEKSKELRKKLRDIIK